MISPFHAGKRLSESSLAFSIHDKYPVSPGHVLVVPKRAVTHLSYITREELEAIYVLLITEMEKSHATGFNIGINQGRDAGQTIPQFHVHLIPRFMGDVDDPTGGVRNIIPGKGDYRQIEYSLKELGEHL